MANNVGWLSGREGPKNSWTSPKKKKKILRQRRCDTFLHATDTRVLETLNLSRIKKPNKKMANLSVSPSCVQLPNYSKLRNYSTMLHPKLPSAVSMLVHNPEC